MGTMTSSQLGKFAKLAGQKEVTSERAQLLYGSGLQADLFEVEDPSTIDRDAFRKFLGLSPLEFLSIVDFDQTLPEMIAAADFDSVNSNITSERFPVVGSGKKNFRFKIYKPKRFISSEAADEMMRKDGFLAARHESGLAFARDFPNEQRKRPIALLGSSAKVSRDRCVSCLRWSGAERDLDLRYWQVGWGGGWGFLGAQEVSGT